MVFFGGVKITPNFASGKTPLAEGQIVTFTPYNNRPFL